MAAGQLGDWTPRETMTPERWQRVKQLLDLALDLEDWQRETFVIGECSGDTTLSAEVMDLLAGAGAADHFIEEPAVLLLADGEHRLVAGARFGPYRVLREIGHGGMGSVVLAERDDAEYVKRVAIKVVRRGMDTEEIVRRFRQERQILANLAHPNIAALLDGGTTDDGLSYFVMEYVEGTPVDQYCRAAALPQRARLELFLTVCSAVHFAHQNLVVHRDLKPANILVTTAGVPKLLDFGIAKLLQDEQPLSTLVLQPGLRLMTPEYASPEQRQGGQITTATDVYGLGLLLHLLLLGRLPQRDPAPAAAAAGTAGNGRAAAPGGGSGGAVAGESISARTMAALHGDLGNIVAKALREEPGRRYASAQALADDVSRHLQGLPVEARPDTWGYRTGKFVRRHRAGVAAAGLLLLLIVGFGVAVTVLLGKSVREQRRAERVLTFLNDLLSNPDPGKSRGTTMTLREALDRGREKILAGMSEDPQTRATLMETMGRVYGKLDLYEPELQLAREAVQLRRAALGNDDPKLAESLHSLANALRRTGDNAAAEPYLREALAIQERHAPDGDAEVARGRNNLASLLEEQGQIAEAEKLYREALAIQRRILGNQHPDVAKTLNNLAGLLQAKGELAAAEPLYREALTIYRRCFGKDPHPDVAMTLNNLAMLREDRGDPAEAEQLFGQTLAMRRRLYGEGPLVARTLNNLGHLREAQGDAAGAEALYRQAIAIYDQPGLSRRHTERAIYLRNLASLLAAHGGAARAEPLAREALSIFRTATPAAWRTPDAESVLGGCLTALGRYVEAEPLLLDGYQRLSQASGEGRQHLREAARRLVELYTASKREDRAAVYRTLQDAS